MRQRTGGMRSVCSVMAGLFLLAGCALDGRLHEVDEHIASTRSELEDGYRRFRTAITDIAARREAQQVNRPWVAGRAQPLAREVTLPRALQADVKTTLLFADGPLTLPEIARRITAVTSIPVRVRAEALLPAEAFMPRLAQEHGSTAIKATDRVALSGQAEPLARILDRIGAALDVAWDYRQGGLVFYRTQTRVFNIHALTLNASAEASLGQVADHGSAAGFSSTSRTSLQSSATDVFDMVRERIEPFLSRAGILAAQPGTTASIVVTDTPEVLEQIAAFIEHENRIMTRRVRLVFEEVTLATHEDAQAGLDWDLIFSSARVAAMASMGGLGLVEAGVASLGLNQGPLAGSEAIVAALSQFGKVVRRSSIPVLTLNRRPVTHAVRTTFSYIDKIDTTALGEGASMALPSVSVSQKEETVGSVLTLVPDGQDDGRILLSIAYDTTVAQPVRTVTFGDRGNALQLQQITIEGNGTVQQVVLEPGQPVVISGFDRVQEEADSSRPAQGLPLLFGGRDQARAQQQMTVLIVTAQLEEGV